MKPIALFFVIALVPAAVLAAHAKTINTTESGSNQKSVAGVAGPARAAENSGTAEKAADQSASRQPSKKTLKKAKVTPPPPLHDPN